MSQMLHDSSTDSSKYSQINCCLHVDCCLQKSVIEFRRDNSCPPDAGSLAMLRI